jgi:prepilin peptidase CpaA
MQDFTLICLVLVIITSIAAAIDHRRGIIPNYLTYTTFIAAIIWHTGTNGMRGFFASVIGALVSFTVPYLAFRAQAMGGGDVKLFAAIGALAGPGIGLEIELLSLAIVYLYGIVRVAKQGELKQTLTNSFCIATNPFLPRFMRKNVQTESLTSIRLGNAILIATLVCVVNRLWLNGFV